jgi:hypothetical protein
VTTSPDGTRRFAISYHPVLRLLFTTFGMGPAGSGATLTDDELRIRMGWAFRARIPRRAVAGVERVRIPLILGWGVHGWAGRWAVNGARTGTVRLDLDPPSRARVCGVPVRLRTLWLSLSDPDGLLAAVGRSS